MIILIIIVAIFLSASSEAGYYSAANDHLKRQKEFNLALHRRTNAVCDEYFRQTRGKKYEYITGGRVKADVPVKIPEVRFEDYFGERK